MQLQLILLLLLTVGTLGQYDCAKADEVQCLSSLCFNYRYTNTSCVLDQNSTCTSGQVLYDGICVSCSSLSPSNCSTVCPDYFYRNTSSPARCTKCVEGCVRCTASTCLICALSSNLTLSSDGQLCLNSTCADTNCLTCYSGGTKCSKCKTGFKISTTNFTCIVASCSVANCIVCASASTCASCYPNYALKQNGSVCDPVCDDINCKDCIAPGVCGACLTAYSPDASGFCVIDCSQIAVSNCATCINAAVCVSCKAGFTLQSQGTACVATCQVTDCDICVPGDTSTCQRCNKGFGLSTNGKSCTTAFCTIDNCQTCGSLTQCASCISNYTLSADNKTCTSICTFANCQLCSNTACTTCDDGYYLNATSGTCYLICQAITNCVRCFSETQCASCASNYRASDDLGTCLAVCRDTNCLTCANPTTLVCTVCKAGFSISPTSGRCQKQCQQGQVDVSSTSTVNCQDCNVLVSNCVTCTYLTNTNITICNKCQQGSFLNGELCERCSNAITGCIKCTTATKCTSCSSTTKLIDGLCQTGTCDAGVRNCYACKSTSTNVCAICNPGFNLNSNVCTSVTCSTGFIIDLDNNVCVCPLGTYKKGDACLPCQNSNCLNCTISSCASCKEGYFPVGTTCQNCISNCKSCTSGSNCVECNTGFSKGADGTCFSFGNGKLAAASDTGAYYGCPEGCLTCVVGSSATQRIICLTPKTGYALVGGAIARCSAICQTCASTQTTLCTSCYPKYALSSGTCTTCTDPQALTCSPLDAAYSLTCKPGFTAGFNPSTGNAGVCTACSAYCSQCEAAGPGNCDDGQCAPGSVQLVGTKNCTQCFEGCVKCDSSNLNSCLDCGFRRYLDPNTSTCGRCNNGCKNCSTTATNCQACDQGYFLVNGSSCVLVPSNCYGLTPTGLCQGCFVGYALNADSTACAVSVECNDTRSCQTCPEGYFINDQQCFLCNLPANCRQCDAADNSKCLGCNVGFYVDSDAVCQTCTANCAACDSQIFCTQPEPGFYIILDASSQYTGQVAACTSPCATCVDNAGFCLSCIADYTLTGSKCRRNTFLQVVLVLGPGDGAGSIFSPTDEPELQVFLTMAAINRLIDSFAAAQPQELKSDGVSYRQKNLIKSITTGSVKIAQEIDAGSFKDPDAARNSVSSSFNNIDGASVVSNAVTAQGFNDNSDTSSDDGGANLGLILGLSIPLGVLLIVVIILIVYSCRNDEDDYEEDNRNGFYSEDKIDRIEAI